MALLNSRSCLALFFVVCLATPLYASPLFFGIFRKNSSRTSTSRGSSSATTPRNFAINFRVSTSEEATQPSFFERITSGARLVSAFLKSFLAVITNRHNSDTTSVDEIAADDSFADYDPFGVEPSESEIDFFADLDSSTSANVISRGRSLDSRVDDAAVPSDGQNLNSESDDQDSVSIGQNESAGMDGKDVMINGEDAVMDGEEALSSSHNDDPMMNEKDEMIRGKDEMMRGEDPMINGEGPRINGEDPTMDGEDAITSGQNEVARMGGKDAVPSDPFADPDLPSSDITRAKLLGSVRLV